MGGIARSLPSAGAQEDVPQQSAEAGKRQQLHEDEEADYAEHSAHDALDFMNRPFFRRRGFSRSWRFSFLHRSPHPAAMIVMPAHEATPVNFSLPRSKHVTRPSFRRIQFERRYQPRDGLLRHDVDEVA